MEKREPLMIKVNNIVYHANPKNNTKKEDTSDSYGLHSGKVARGPLK